MIRYDANKITYMLHKMFNPTPVLFTDKKIAPGSVSKALHIYELQHNGLKRDRPVLMAHEVRKNFFGTIISLVPLEIRSGGTEVNSEAWKQGCNGNIMTLYEYINEYYKE